MAIPITTVKLPTKDDKSNNSKSSSWLGAFLPRWGKMMPLKTSKTWKPNDSYRSPGDQIGWEEVETKDANGDDEFDAADS